MAIFSNKDAAFVHAPPVQAGASWQLEKVTPFLRERTGALALKRVLPPAEIEQAAALPMLATASDVREVVRLLRKKEAGISIIEGMEAARRIFDPRKVAAYEYWGLIKRTGDRLALSALGWEFARRLEPETRLYRVMLAGALAYRSALEWVFRQNLEIVTDADIAAFWLENPAEIVLAGNSKAIEGNVVCFFHLCQEAELGMATVGKRGQPTRLRVDRKELADYIAASHSRAQDEGPSHDAPAKSAPAPKAAQTLFAPAHSGASQSTEKMRVLISQRSAAEQVSRIQAALEVAEIESEINRRTASDAALVPDALCRAMRRCHAAIIVVTGEDCRMDALGEPTLEEGVLMEIAAAIVRFDGRVILLWEAGLPLPARLCGLCRCEFASSGLTWDSGMQLLKALKSFQS